MSSVPPPHLDEVLKEASCPVCYDLFRSSPRKTKEGRVLHCGHLLCTACLMQLQPETSGHKACPVCRSKIFSAGSRPVVRQISILASELIRVDNEKSAMIDALQSQLHAANAALAELKSKETVVVATAGTSAQEKDPVPAATAASDTTDRRAIRRSSGPLGDVSGPKRRRTDDV